jgi:hypothetical protein
MEDAVVNRTKSSPSEEFPTPVRRNMTYETERHDTYAGGSYEGGESEPEGTQ